jgi:hypothetical protein
MKLLLPLLLLAYCASLAAGVYRWVDADGRVHFSDRRDAGSEQLGIKEHPKGLEAAKTPEPPASPDAQILGPYTAFEIVAPAPNATFIQENNDLAVSLILDPVLIQGHRLEVLLDGVAKPLTEATTQFTLTKLVLGSHRLQVQIRDTDGQPIARTAAETFHLRKPQQPGVLR